MSLLERASRLAPSPASPGQSERELRALLRNVRICYFLSGATGLIYQILWLRKLLLVFGSTVHAVSTVLTVFFGGLALGSWLFGKLIDRREASGLRWYAALEALIGLYAFLTLPLFDAIQRIYIPMYRASDFSTAALIGGSFLCSAAILLVPTTLMGGTFPILNRFLIRSSEERGSRIANLYAINTIGAMTGTVGIYFVGLPALGLTRALICTGILNLGIGALCLIFDRHLESLGFRTAARQALPAAAPTDGREPVGLVRWLFVAFGLSGFSAMVYEVAWTRALSLVLGSSIYAFCIILATFLGGIALGSFVAQRDLRTDRASIAQVILLELFLGAYGLVSVPLFNQLPQWFVTLWPITGGMFEALSLLQMGLSAVILLIPTVLMGFLFPLVSDLVTREWTQLGRRLGTAYAVNTFGGILGSFLSGFLLIPLLGLPWAIVIAALVNLAAGLMLYGRFGRGGSGAGVRSTRVRFGMSGVALAAAVVIGAAGVVPLWQRQVLSAGVYLNPLAYPQGSLQQGLPGMGKLLYYRDSLNATVSVQQAGDSLFLKVGGKTDASNGIDMSTQVLSAHIPMLLHPDPRSVMVIGLGSGVTLGQASRHPVSILHCAEIDEAVIEAARYFKAYNDNVHEDPRARFFAVDGRNFLLATPQRYDVIISEPSNPWMAGLAYLFTKEFYELARARLAPGGVMCQWLQLYKIFPSDVKLMLKTFHAVFPHVTVWSTIPGDLLLIGTMEPQRFEYAQLARRMAQPSIKAGLAVVRADDPGALLEMFWLGNPELELLTADITWVHEDDQPSVEFNAPQALYFDRAASVNYAGLEQFNRSAASIVSGYEEDESDPARSVALADLWEFREEPRRAKKALEQVVARDPEAADAWRRLGELALRRDQPLEAADALTRATQVNPRDAQALRLLGRIRCAQDEFEAAQRLYERSASLAAPTGEAAEEIGQCLSRAEAFRWAAEYYRSAISQGGGDRVAVVTAFGRALKELKELEAAEAVLRYGAAVFAADAVFPLQLGNILLDQGRTLESTPWFEQALALSPKNARAYYGLARSAFSQGDHALAKRLLKEALRYGPYDREALELWQQLETRT